MGEHRKAHAQPQRLETDNRQYGLDRCFELVPYARRGKFSPDQRSSLMERAGRRDIDRLRDFLGPLSNRDQFLVAGSGWVVHRERHPEHELVEVADETSVYPGHGDDTTIGAERPHLAEWKERGCKANRPALPDSL